ncbi:acyl-protein thioesterase [Xylariales sp. PMI_506]|nr:acyl-protein thioesterase [Xylariales sp. PMI_506]
MELARSVVLPQKEHTHTVIFLHGRGDTAQSLAENLFLLKDTYGRSLDEIFPSVRWVFPQAEIIFCEKENQEWSQWFDVWNTLDFSDREELQAPGLQESVRSLIRLTHLEAQAVGGLDRVVLAGFSQGGSTVMHVALNLPSIDIPNASPGPARLAGLIGISCRLPFPGGTLEETREVLGLDTTPNDEILRDTPVFLAHCVDDPLVLVEYGRQLSASLTGFGMKGVSLEYSEGGHQIQAPQGIDDMVVYLKTQGLPAAED